MIECLHTWTSSGIGLYTKFLALVWGSMISTRPVRMPPRGPQESTRIPHRTAPEMFIEPPIVKTKLKATWSVKAADMIWQTADASNKYLPSSSKLIAPCFFFGSWTSIFLAKFGSGSGAPCTGDSPITKMTSKQRTTFSARWHDLQPWPNENCIESYLSK